MNNERHIELQDLEENKRPGEPQPRKQKPHILFEGELPPQYSGQNLPVELAIKRNMTIKALILQLFSIFAGFAFFFVRRLVIYLIANTLSLGFIYFGFTGTLRLQKWGIAAHSIFTMGVIGITWAYLVLEALFVKEYQPSGPGHTSERVTMFLLGLPYLVDLVCGIVSMNLTYYIFKLEETRQRNEDAAGNIIAHQAYNEQMEECCICMNFQKNVAIYPCGHVCLCNYCGQEFKRKKVKNCPICRAQIKDIIHLYR